MYHKSIISALVLIAAAALPVTADTKTKVGTIHQIQIKQQHPKAYHPRQGDLVYCYIQHPVLANPPKIRFKIVKGNSIKPLGVFSCPVLTPDGKPVLGSSRLGVMFTVVGDGLSNVEITPIGSDGSAPTKPYTLSFLPEDKDKNKND